MKKVNIGTSAVKFFFQGRSNAHNTHKIRQPCQQFSDKCMHATRLIRARWTLFNTGMLNAAACFLPSSAGYLCCLTGWCHRVHGTNIKKVDAKGCVPTRVGVSTHRISAAVQVLKLPSKHARIQPYASED